MRPVFDTNILIDYLNGIEEARKELDQFPGHCISVITWIEVMAGVRTEDEDSQVRRFLGRFQPLPVDLQVAETTCVIRRTHRLRLPDAVIWATARRAGTLLVTRNTKDFPEGQPDIRVPYRL